MIPTWVFPILWIFRTKGTSSNSQSCSAALVINTKWEFHKSILACSILAANGECPPCDCDHPWDLLIIKECFLHCSLGVGSNIIDSETVQLCPALIHVMAPQEFVDRLLGAILNTGISRGYKKVKSLTWSSVVENSAFTCLQVTEISSRLEIPSLSTHGIA